MLGSVEWRWKAGVSQHMIGSSMSKSSPPEAFAEWLSEGCSLPRNPGECVPSRFGCQSGDCGYVVRGHLTARYLAAVPRRILLMEQQVWSILHARQSILRPRVAVPPPHRTFQGHAAHITGWSMMLRPNGSWGTCIP